MSLWEARLSTEHVGRYMDCGVGSSDLEYMKCSETGLWGQRHCTQVHEVAHGGLPIHSVHVTPPITAGRTWDSGKGVSMDKCLKDLHTSLLGHPEL